MLSIGESLLVHTPLGITFEPTRAGTALENPYVYDTAAAAGQTLAPSDRV